MNVEEAIKVIIDMGEHECFVDEPISKKSVLNIINQIDEPKRVVIPKFVAEWIEECKIKGYGIGECITNSVEYKMPDEVIAWFDIDKATEKDKELLVARAFLDGYKIEQEKLYTVEIPNPNASLGHLYLEKFKGKVSINHTISNKWGLNKRCQLTEAEIREDFDWAWQWAEPIGEVE